MEGNFKVCMDCCQRCEWKTSRGLQCGLCEVSEEGTLKSVEGIYDASGSVPLGEQGGLFELYWEGLSGAYRGLSEVFRVDLYRYTGLTH